jgi:hypothetical protein
VSQEVYWGGESTDSMILTRLPMTAPARRMLVRVSVVIVPDGADVTWVGFEEKFRHRVDAYRRDAADRTR